MNKIKEIRTSLGMTVRDLSQKADVAIGYISKLENDEKGTSNPTKEVMTKVADALGKTVPEVFF